MIRLLNNFSVKARLYLAIVFFLLTLLAALSQAYLSEQINIDFAAKEKLGNEIQRPTALMLRDASLLRAYLALAAFSSAPPELDTIVGNITAQMDILKGIEEKVRVPLDFTEQGLAGRNRSQLKYDTVRAKWDDLAQKVGSDPANAQTRDLLVSFIADLRGIIAHSGDTSNLILDPDLDSYYLMDVTLLAMPQTIDRLGEIAGKFYGHAAYADHMQDKAVQIEAAVMSKMLSDADIARIAADMDTSFKEDQNFYGVSPGYKEKYAPLFEAYKASSVKLADLLLMMSAAQDVSLPTLRGALESAIGSSGDFVNDGYDQLDQMLDIRIKSYRSRQVHIILVSAAGVLVSMLFYTFVAFSISSPLIVLKQAMQTLAEADYSVEVPYTDRTSEIGQMAKTVEVFKENGLESIRLKSEQERLQLQAEEDKKRMMRELADSFDSQVGGTIEALSGAANRLQDAARHIEQTARETEDASASVAAASEETSANVSTVASATEEMSASAMEISKQVSDVARKSSEASGSARDTSQQVSELNKLVDNIGEVVTAIKDIAEQTNLLALNATIEAARAGEAGKGFAVVADEVKKLATETSKKTGEIDTRISHIQTATQVSVNAMQFIINNVSDIDVLASSAASAVEEQNAAISEITRNITEVSNAAHDVSSVIGEVQRGAVETGEAAAMLKTSSEEISNLASMLQNAVAGFLANIRR